MGFEIGIDFGIVRRCDLIYWSFVGRVSGELV